MRVQFNLFIIFCLFTACKNVDSIEKADMILVNGTIMTMDRDHPNVQSVAIKDGIFLATGKDDAMIKKYLGDSTKVIDLNGRFAMPGLIEGHGHFISMGRGLSQLNLLHTHSWEEIVDSVRQRVTKLKPGTWIFGRGWHQEKWDHLPLNTYFGYPDHRDLSAVSPDNPVLLLHASGHALFANKKAMEIAGISRETPDPEGGVILRFEEGSPIGVFEENAMSSIRQSFNHFIQSKSDSEKNETFIRAMERASSNCLKWGITSFQDAGTTPEELELLSKYSDHLGVRLNVMLLGLPHELRRYLNKNRLKDFDEMLSCRAIKAYLDGALGSYGAWMLASYSDKPEYFGQNTTPIDTLESLAKIAAKNHLQFCVHAIGDRANREVLDLIQRMRDNSSLYPDHRWRIEHAQHIDTADIPRFAQLGVIASMQPIHCTSDAPFVIKRLDSTRAALSAYPWRALLDHKARMAIGTDVPVEEINPFVNMYAALTRKRRDNGMSLFPEQAMTRDEILHGYTIWNAYAAREEDLKGSISPGKYADIIILSKNLQKCKTEEIPNTRLIYSILGGKVVYASKKN